MLGVSYGPAPGLCASEVLAGQVGGDALTATLLYRIIAFWLPLPAGGLAYLLFQRRHRTSPR